MRKTILIISSLVSILIFLVVSLVQDYYKTVRGDNCRPPIKEMITLYANGNKNISVMGENIALRFDKTLIDLTASEKIYLGVMQDNLVKIQEENLVKLKLKEVEEFNKQHKLLEQP